jgi:ankyrin repeat protein
LLNAGLSASDAGTTGMPPLHHALMSACQYGVRPTSNEARRIVAALLAHGAGPNALDEQGNPALMRAAGVCDAAVIGQLVAAGADIQAKNAANMTAFAVMVAMGDSEGAGALLDAGFRFSPEDAESVREWFTDDPAKRKLLERAGGKR